MPRSPRAQAEQTPTTSASAEQTPLEPTVKDSEQTDIQMPEQPQVDPSVTPVQEGITTSPAQYQVIAANQLRLRPTPGTNYPEILLMPYGAIVTAVDEGGDISGVHWLQVTTSAGIVGFAMSQYLKKLN